MQTKEIISSM